MKIEGSAVSIWRDRPIPLPLLGNPARFYRPITEAILGHEKKKNIIIIFEKNIGNLNIYSIIP